MHVVGRTGKSRRGRAEFVKKVFIFFLYGVCSPLPLWLACFHAQAAPGAGSREADPASLQSGQLGIAALLQASLLHELDSYSNGSTIQQYNDSSSERTNEKFISIR